MAWIFDTYSMNKGHPALGVVTGKPLDIGGSLGREEATSRGAFFTVREVLKKLDRDFDDLTCVVQGFGNVGSYLAVFLHEHGAKVIGISDSAVALHNEKGIDIPAAFAWKREHGTLRGFPGAEEIDAEELLELECDLLAPCALEQVITAENADRIRASIICEGANGPVTPEADEILEERGIIVLPDILANAGGVVVSYFEWVQGLQQYFWSEQEVDSRLDAIITRAFDETWQLHEERELPLRLAAYGLAVERVRQRDDHPRHLSVEPAPEIARPATRQQASRGGRFRSECGCRAASTGRSLGPCIRQPRSAPRSASGSRTIPAPSPVWPPRSARPAGCSARSTSSASRGRRRSATSTSSPTTSSISTRSSTPSGRSMASR